MPGVEAAEIHVTDFFILFGVVEEMSDICATTEESFPWLQRFGDYEILKERLSLWVHIKLTFDITRPDLDNITVQYNTIQFYFPFEHIYLHIFNLN